MWENCNEDLLDVLNKLYIEGEASTEQKHGHILCLPKVNNPVSPEHYRPHTILKIDYKLLTRILAYRLRPWMEEVIHHNQYCGRNGKTKYDAVATVRDIIAYAEVSNTSLCLLSIDFSDAFDKISHAFLFKILEKYGISKTFRISTKGPHPL